MNIRFKDVGRDKKTWTEEIQTVDGELNGHAMEKSIRKHKALMSREIDFHDDGSISAGGRTVGQWEVVE